MRKYRSAAVCAGALAVAAPLPAAPAADNVATLTALRDADARLAGIAYRLTTGNVALCRSRAPTPGWAIHALGQYEAGMREAARQVFAFEAPVSVELVVPGSPAARAGLIANDALLSVDGAAFDQRAPDASADSAERDAAAALIARQSPTAPLVLLVEHAGQRREVTVAPSPGCRSRFELLLGPDLTAQSDGDIVQIGVRFLERYGDDDIAVIVAHELAHTILEHRRRLEAVGVSKGLFADFGRNGRLNRRAEDEADQLSVALLRNAGYDPRAAVRFWQGAGSKIDGGLFRSRTHGSAKARARAIEAAIDAIPNNAPMPYIPPLLATRDQPFR